MPTEYKLSQNYPNPFNPTTRIKFGIPNQSDVSIAIYNMLGQKVITLKNEITDAGHYEVVWNGISEHGNRVASGMYFYVLQAKNVKTRKML